MKYVEYYTENGELNFVITPFKNVRKHFSIHIYNFLNEARGGIYIFEDLDIAKNAVIDMLLREHFVNVRLSEEKLKNYQFQIVSDDSRCFQIRFRHKNQLFDFRSFSKVAGGLDTKKVNNNKYVAVKNIVEALDRMKILSVTLGSGIRQLWINKFNGAVEVRGKRYNTKEIDEEMYRYIQGTNNGGLCVANPRFRGKIMKDTITIDKNAHYASMALKYALPCDTPVFMTPEEYVAQKQYTTGIFKVHVKEAAIRSGFVPTWGFKEKGQRVEKEYLAHFKNKIVYLWQHELKYYEKYYKMNYRIMRVLAFKRRKALLNPIIEHFIQIKENAEDPTERIIAKRAIPALIGKFGSCRYRINEIYTESGTEKYDMKSDDFYLPLFTYITSRAACDIGTYIQAFGIDEFIYSDTDSITAKGQSQVYGILEFNKSKTGCFKLESVNKEFIVLKNKVYAKRLDDGTLKNVVSGVSIKRPKTPEQFYNGVEFSFEIYDCSGIVPKAETKVVKFANKKL